MITKDDVASLLGLPNIGKKICDTNDTCDYDPPTRTHLFQLQDEIGDDVNFDQYFIIATCFTVLALISKEGKKTLGIHQRAP